MTWPYGGGYYTDSDVDAAPAAATYYDIVTRHSTRPQRARDPTNSATWYSASGSLNQSLKAAQVPNNFAPDN